jgi:ribosomal protein S27AE
MRVLARLKKLESALPKCDAAVRELVSSDYVPTEADRCSRCGEYHFLVVHEEIVEAPHPGGEIGSGSN